MSKLDISTSRTKSGLTIVRINLPNFHTITNFLAIRSGSRYETSENNGIAHFLEHMVFKGTEKYPDTAAISQAIESVGGYFNAWTSLDHTCYWNIVSAASWQLGIEVVFQLAYRALLREEDLERERGVIIEEIRRIQDDPASYVDDLSGGLLFDGNPLARPIIGTEKNIKAMTIEQFKQYRLRHYNPSQSLFIAIGNLENLPIDSVVEQQIADFKAQEQSVFEPVTVPSSSGLKLINKSTDQTHFILGVSDPVLSMKDDQSYVGEVLNTILGRGMSSRLFLNVREKQGLAYAIHSSLMTLEDTGAVAIYGGVNTGKVELALKAVDEEIAKLKNEKVGDKELKKAKAMVAGSYDIKADEPIELAKWYGIGTLLHRQETFEEARAKIEAVTAAQVQKLAQTILAKDRQTLAVIGPYDSDKIFTDFLSHTD